VNVFMLFHLFLDFFKNPRLNKEKAFKTCV